MYLYGIGPYGKRTIILLSSDEEEDRLLQEHQAYGERLPKMLTDEQRERLKRYYAELAHYNKLRKQGVDCWAEYYGVLKRIKYLLRYNR